MLRPSALPAACLWLLASACSREATPAPKTIGDLPPGLFAAAEPAGARDVDEVRKAAKPGDEVTLVGRIGGRKQPFVAGRAQFAMVSPKLKTCAENPDDDCKTPWDYCCEDKATMLAHTATVRVPAGDGEPLPLDLEGRNGLAPGARIVVKGKVRENDQALVIDARELFVAAPR